MNTVPQYLIYISLFVEALLGLYLMTRILPSKAKKPLSKRQIAERIAIGLLYCTALGIQQYLGVNKQMDTFLLYQVLHMLFPFLYACLFLRGSWKLKCFLGLIFSSIIMLVAFPVNLVFQDFASQLPVSIDMSSMAIQVISRIIRILFNYLSIAFLAHFPFSIEEKYPKSYYWVMFCTPALNIGVMMTLLKKSNYADSISAVGSCIFFLEFITYYMMWQSTTEYNKRIRSELVNQQMRYEMEYMNNLNDVVNEYHHLRHDMKNHIACMDLLLSQGKEKELKNYFYNLSKNVYAIDCQIESGNLLVNQVLNMKYVMAQNMNIPIEYHATLPETLPIPDTSLCSLLSNLLDNALEASEKIKEPHVWLEMSIVKCYLAIKITNRIEDWQKPMAMAYQTTKNLAYLHGFGKRIVEKIVKQYNGTIDYECGDDYFRVSILILLEEE